MKECRDHLEESKSHCMKDIYTLSSLEFCDKKKTIVTIYCGCRIIPITMLYYASTGIDQAEGLI